MAKYKWNIDTMNEYCQNNANGYSVIELKYIQKPYQKQLWALVQCPNCKHEPYWVCWNGFIRGGRCKQCYMENNNYTSWDVDKVYSFCKEHGFIMMNKNDFQNIDKSFYCYDKDSFIFKISISNLKRLIRGEHSRGFSITKNNKYAVENIRLFCKKYRPDYLFISDTFLGVKEKHIFKYIGDELKDNVEKTFQCTVDCFINGWVKHPRLSISKYELKVKDILIENNISFIQQYKFFDCKDKQTLPFDFYLPEYNTCIEVQGAQHYMAIDYFGGLETFNYTKIHDKIKKRILFKK